MSRRSVSRPDIFMDDYKGYGLHVTPEGKFKALKKEGEGKQQYYSSREEMTADTLEQIKAKVDRITKAKFTPHPAWVRDGYRYRQEDGYRLVTITSHNTETGDTWIKNGAGDREKVYGEVYKDSPLNKTLIAEINVAAGRKKAEEETIEKLEKKLEVMYGR